MAETLFPRRRRRWWIIPLMLVLLYVGGRMVVDRVSWKVASGGVSACRHRSARQLPTRVWAGRLAEYKGMAWFRMPYPVHSDDLYADDEMSLTAENWLQQRQNDECELMGAFAQDRTHVYAQTRDALLMYNGLWWTYQAAAPLPEGTVQAWVQTPESIITLDDQGRVFHYTDSAWNEMPLPQGFEAIAIDGSGQRLTITARAVLGNDPADRPWAVLSRDFDVWDMAALEDDQVFAVGSSILHYNGSYWHEMSYPFDMGPKTPTELPPTLPHCSSGRGMTLQACVPEPLYAIDVLDGEHIYAVGAAGILQYDGKAWSAMPVAQGLFPQPWEVWAQHEQSVYALDPTLGLLHWDGYVWDVVAVPGGFAPVAVGGTADAVALVGEGLTVLIDSGDGWVEHNLGALIAELPAEITGVDSLVSQLDKVWGIADDCIIIGVWHEDDAMAWPGKRCACLLSYSEGTWSALAGPDDEDLFDSLEAWSPRQMAATPWEGGLRAIDGHGRCWNFVRNTWVRVYVPWEGYWVGDYLLTRLSDFAGPDAIAMLSFRGAFDQCPDWYDACVRPGGSPEWRYPDW